MKLHIVTIGRPKLPYAKLGWDEYLTRLRHYHQVRTTHIADKYNDASHILEAAANTYRIALDSTGHSFTSPQLAAWLEKLAIQSREVSFIIGGPEGLPPEVLNQADYHWSLSQLTFPHDLAMLILAETLYRATTITAGHPYHK